MHEESLDSDSISPPKPPSKTRNPDHQKMWLGGCSRFERDELAAPEQIFSAFLV
jgi:hypothetical protein